MSTSYYQVVGNKPWMIDHPRGDSVSYRPGQIFEESPLVRSVQRGLRTNALRELSKREAAGLRNAELVNLQLKMGTHKSQNKPVKSSASAPVEPPKPPEPILKKQSGKAESK